LLLWDIIFRCDTQYDTNQTAVGTVHMIATLTWWRHCQQMIAGRVGRGRVQAILYIFIITQFWDFTWYSIVYISLQINTLLCYTLVPVVVLGIGIDKGWYYWILDIGCLAWYRSNPSLHRHHLWMFLEDTVLVYWLH